ncbi:MAG TPA: WecB/TagA/CpsF family glycosyltransferase [Acidobacteriaceae bacterium]|jgi:N-acetylglucosaminyldiphosphoundecaprenol N-acetyl-beta-D-mannosaminyltransferase|nr:WecB/TagA/CpsF family glycosyltransferase [Acidobacteriaceae bacterium]
MDLCSRQLSLGGIRIDALEQRDLIQLVERAKQTKDKLLILNHNLHSLYLHEANAAFRALYKQASYVYIDGLPVVWLGQMAGLPLTTSHRMTFIDCFDSILEDAAERDWRIFYLGSTEAVLAKALKILRERHKKLIISGRDGFLPNCPAEVDAVIAEINRFGADILFVGMGMPLQEMWLIEHRAKLCASAILTSGGTLDYIAGCAHRPPAWAGKLGLYGLFRLFFDPKRLWRRYLIEPIIVAKGLSPRLFRQRLNIHVDPQKTYVRQLPVRSILSVVSRLRRAWMRPPGTSVETAPDIV